MASRALQVKALQAAKLWECGGGEGVCKDCRLVVLGLGSEA